MGPGMLLRHAVDIIGWPRHAADNIVDVIEWPSIVFLKFCQSYWMGQVMPPKPLSMLLNGSGIVFLKFGQSYNPY